MFLTSLSCYLNICPLSFQKALFWGLKKHFQYEQRAEIKRLLSFEYKKGHTLRENAHPQQIGAVFLTQGHFDRTHGHCCNPQTHELQSETSYAENCKSIARLHVTSTSAVRKKHTWCHNCTHTELAVQVFCVLIQLSTSNKMHNSHQILYGTLMHLTLSPISAHL